MSEPAFDNGRSRRCGLTANEIDTSPTEPLFTNRKTENALATLR